MSLRGLEGALEEFEVVKVCSSVVNSMVWRRP